MMHFQIEIITMFINEIQFYLIKKILNCRSFKTNRAVDSNKVISDQFYIIVNESSVKTINVKMEKKM